MEGGGGGDLRTWITSFRLCSDCFLPFVELRIFSDLS